MKWYLLGAVVTLVIAMINAADRANKGRPLTGGDGLFYSLAVLLWPVTFAMMAMTWNEKRKERKNAGDKADR